MKIAIAGLGKMGAQIAKKLHEDGHTVVVYNRSKGPIDEMKNLGMTPAYERKDMINFFSGEQVIIWMMVPADVVKQELNSDAASRATWDCLVNMNSPGVSPPRSAVGGE